MSQILSLFLLIAPLAAQVHHRTTFTVEELPDGAAPGGGPVSPAGPVRFRTFTLNALSAGEAKDLLLALPTVRDQVPPDRLIPDSSGRRLIVMAPDAVLAVIASLLAEVDRSRPAVTRSLSVNFLTLEDVQRLMTAVGPQALAGLTPRDVAWLSGSRTLLVRGPPEGVDRLASLIAGADRPPQQVTIGLSSVATGSSRVRESGIGLDPVTIRTGEPGRLGGQVRYRSESGRDRATSTVWVTTLDGSPARFDLGSIFNVIVPTATLTPFGVTGSVTPQEVFVGTSLAVTPRVRGSLVELEVAYMQDVPTRVTPLGVDRSTRHVLTRVLVPRGGSASVGGLLESMASAGVARPGLIRSRLQRDQDVSLTLFVK